MVFNYYIKQLLINNILLKKTLYITFSHCTGWPNSYFKMDIEKKLINNDGLRKIKNFVILLYLTLENN